MNNKYAILFDLDGTLIDSGKDLAIAVNHALSCLNLANLEIDEILSYVGDGVQLLIKRSILKAGASDDDLKQALQIFLDFYRKNCTVHTVTYDNVIETLNELSKNYKLAVLTNKGEEIAKIILNQLNMSHLFKAIIGGDTLSVKKPNPLVVEHLSNILDTPIDKMIMVGDHHTDLNTAKNANIPSIFCNFGIGHTDNLKADETVNNFQEIKQVVKTLFK